VNETIKRSLIQTTEDCWCFYDWEGVEGREKELQGFFVEGLKLEALDWRFCRRNFKATVLFSY
jgi:hypothetical protein